MLKKKISFSLISLLAGAILPLAFSPFGHYLFSEISLVILLLIWANTPSAKLAFWYGWLFGLAFFSCGVYWIYISIHNFGHAPIILAVMLLGILIAFLALYPALQGYLLNRLYPQNNWQKLLLAFPASWVILEWVRGWFLSGFPWLFLGYSHIDSPIRGWATIFGVYGISFIVAQTASIIVCMFFWRKKIKSIAFLALLIIILWGFGNYFARIKWTQKINDPIQISLIQGNTPIEQKWNPKKLSSILNDYIYLTTYNFSSKIIVWPEAAIPIYYEHALSFLNQLAKVAKSHNTTIVSGIPFFDKKTQRSYNGIIFFGANEGHYHKRYLVPFGEYMPLRFILNWLHNYLEIPMSDFSSGFKNHNDILLDKIIIAPFICYEIAYTDLVLEYMPKAGLIITVCDDSWFGDSIASTQHAEIARMRSLETGRYQLLSTNSGITAVIDNNGKIVSQAPAFQKVSLTAKIQALSGATPWVKIGQYVWLPLLLLALFFAKIKNVHQNPSHKFSQILRKLGKFFRLC